MDGLVDGLDALPTTLSEPPTGSPGPYELFFVFLENLQLQTDTNSYKPVTNPAESLYLNDSTVTNPI